MSAVQTVLDGTLPTGQLAGALDQGLAAIAPGQSEHPGHSNFGDGLVPWQEGHSALLVSGGLLVESSSVHHLTLEPET